MLANKRREYSWAYQPPVRSDFVDLQIDPCEPFIHCLDLREPETMACDDDN